MKHYLLANWRNQFDFLTDGDTTAINAELFCSFSVHLLSLLESFLSDFKLHKKFFHWKSKHGMLTLESWPTR